MSTGVKEAGPGPINPLPSLGEGIRRRAAQLTHAIASVNPAPERQASAILIAGDEHRREECRRRQSRAEQEPRAEWEEGAEDSNQKEAHGEIGKHLQAPKRGSNGEQHPGGACIGIQIMG